MRKFHLAGRIKANPIRWNQVHEAADRTFIKIVFHNIPLLYLKFFHFTTIFNYCRLFSRKNITLLCAATYIFTSRCKARLWKMIRKIFHRYRLIAILLQSLYNTVHRRIFIIRIAVRLQMNKFKFQKRMKIKTAQLHFGILV